MSIPDLKSRPEHNDRATMMALIGVLQDKTASPVMLDPVSILG